jgi:hypothetical protein
MNALVETIRGAWDTFLGRVLILAAIAGGPFFYFIGQAASMLGN